MMKNEAILALLQEHVSRDIETTKPQMMDSLDFRDVYIGSLVDLVKAAFEKGLDQGYEEGLEAAQDMAATYAQECGE
jgi:hypothetical protein